MAVAHAARAGWGAALAASAALGACTDEVIVTPIIVSPVDDPDAAAFPTLDAITITIAHAGDDRDLVSQTFTRGQRLAIAGAPFGDDLVIHMAGFIGESPVAYGRTCAFEVTPDGPPPAPHLFFARRQKFAGTGMMPLARSGGRAASLLGHGVFVGGTMAGAPVQDVEQFDPLGNELTTVGTVIGRVGAVDALVGAAPGRIALIGGLVEGAPADFIELIDGRRGIDMHSDAHMARIGLTATSLTDGRVIAIGGQVPFAPAVGTITEVAPSGETVEVRDLRAVLAYPRTGHTATRLGDDLGAPVLIAGGRTGLDAVDGPGTPVAIAELFKPLAEELASPATFAPAMIVPRAQHHAARMPDGSVLFIGGVDGAGGPVRTLELFSLDAGFVAVGELPPTAGVVGATVTPLPDGRILITGGRPDPAGSPTDTAFIARLDPLDGSVDVVATDRLAVARAGHQAAVLCDGTILITGGTDAPTVAERYNPPPEGRR